jgi:hypothetical protein
MWCKLTGETKVIAHREAIGKPRRIGIARRDAIIIMRDAPLGEGPLDQGILEIARGDPGIERDPGANIRLIHEELVAGRQERTPRESRTIPFRNIEQPASEMFQDQAPEIRREATTAVDGDDIPLKRIGDGMLRELTPADPVIILPELPEMFPVGEMLWGRQETLLIAPLEPLADEIGQRDIFMRTLWILGHSSSSSIYQC